MSAFKLNMSMRPKLLFTYLCKEFIINFTLSFMFFFFIYFINQILLILQRDEVKNLSIRIIIELVLLSTPQFLIFTFPFSTLTSVAMLTGDLASKNEILAMRSLGMSLRSIFKPLLFMSILTGLGTYWIADTVNPWAADQYKIVYARVIRNMPTIALKPNSVSTIGSVSVSVGQVRGENIDDIRIIDSSNPEQARLVVAKSGKIQQRSKDSYVYQLVLFEPQIMFTSTQDDRKYTLASSKDMVYSIDMTSLLPSFGEPNSTQVKTKELLKVISSEKKTEANNAIAKSKEMYDAAVTATSSISDIYKMTNSNNIFQNIGKVSDNYSKYMKTGRKNTITFRRVYNETELYKRISLSIACMVLALLAFPLSFFKVKHGKLIGFAISMVISVAYWSMLFFAQFSSLTNYEKPFMWKLFFPDALFLVVAAILLWRQNKT